MTNRGRRSNVKIAASEAPKLPMPYLSDDVSIDDLMSKGLKAMYGIMRVVNAEVESGAPSRNTVMNLKDVMSILQVLKKDERDVLDALSVPELEKKLTNVE